MAQTILNSDFRTNTIRAANTKTRIQSDRSSFVPLLAINGGATLLNGKQTDVTVTSNPADVVAAEGKIWVARSDTTAAKVLNAETNATLSSPTLQIGAHYQATFSTSTINDNQLYGPMWLAYNAGTTEWHFDLIRALSNPSGQYSTGSGGKKVSGGGTRGFTGIEYSNNGYVWMVDSGGALVWRFDIGGGAGDLSIAISTAADMLGSTCYDGKYVWIADSTSTGANTQRVWALDTTNSTPYEVKYGPGSAANDQTTKLCYAGDSIWQACNGLLKIFRIVEADIDNAPGLTIDLTNLGSYAVLELCYAGRYMFVTTTGADVLKFDIESLQLVETISGLTAPTYMAFDGTSLWVSNSTGSVLTRLLV